MIQDFRPDGKLAIYAIRLQERRHRKCTKEMYRSLTDLYPVSPLLSAAHVNYYYMQVDVRHAMMPDPEGADPQRSRFSPPWTAS